jgi:peroxiredoxin
VVAAAEESEQTGNDQYFDDHMGAIFKEGFSFSGFERDMVSLSLDGQRFLDISGVSGLDSVSDGRGSLFADFDNDGDLDVFLTAVQREAHYLFRNNVGSLNNFLRVELEGTTSGRDAYGAVVRVKSSIGTLTKIKSGGSGFLSQSDPRLVFGLGQDRAAEWVEVTWPGGVTERFDNIEADQTLHLVEGRDEWAAVAEKRFSLVDPASDREIRLARYAFAPGQRFPDLQLATLAGETLPISKLLRPGRRLLVNLWATYCVPCAEEMPELQTMYPALQQAGIDLAGISIDLDPASVVPDYIAAIGVEYPIFSTGEASIPAMFSGEEVLVPSSFLLDDTGRVLEIFIGWTDASREAVHALVED